jgi:hypothetical protein
MNNGRIYTREMFQRALKEFLKRKDKELRNKKLNRIKVEN